MHPNRGGEVAPEPRALWGGSWTAALIDELPLGILLVRGDLAVCYANAAARQMLALGEVAEPSLAGTSLGRVMSRFGLPAVRELQVWAGSVRLSERDSEPDDLELSVLPVREGGQLLGAVVLKPVPQAVVAEDNSRLLAAVIANSTEFVAWHGPIGAEARINPAAAAMIGGGVRPDEPLPHQIRDLFEPESQERINAEGVAAMYGQGAWHDRLHLRNRDNGEVKLIDWSMFVVRDADGRVLGSAGMGRDVTKWEEAAVRSLERRLIVAEEEERRRIASEIHDDSAQALTAVSLRLQRLRRRLHGADADMLRDAEQATAAALTRLRRLIFDLHPPALDTEGLAAALRQYVSETLDAAAPPVTFTETGSSDLLDRAVLSAGYRVAREAVLNAVKHAGATRLHVLVEGDEHGVTVRVVDDGTGFDPTSARTARAGHLGLISSEAMVRSAGGRYRMRSSPGTGTEVEFWLPRPSPDG